MRIAFWGLSAVVVTVGAFVARGVAALTVTGRSAETQLFVEALVMMMVFGVVAWRALATLNRQRELMLASVTHRMLTVESARSARHLHLVPAVER